MPAYITRRVLTSGKPRWVVRYRVGGRGSRIMHVGSFKSQEEAEKWRDRVSAQLAACRLPEYSARDLLIYFARFGELVKIGVSVDPRKRCRDLHADLLFEMRGGIGRERELHRRFAHLRERGEWFRAEPELLEYIEERGVAQRFPVRFESSLPVSSAAAREEGGA